MKKSIVFVAMVVSLIFPALARPQESQSATSQDVPQVSNTRSSSGESGIDTQGIKNYLIGPGDILDVRVFGQSDLNAVVEVDSDGNISSLPFLESPISAKCRTEKEVQKDIVKAYEKYNEAIGADRQLTLKLADPVPEPSPDAAPENSVVDPLLPRA